MGTAYIVRTRAPGAAFVGSLILLALAQPVAADVTWNSADRRIEAGSFIRSLVGNPPQLNVTEDQRAGAGTWTSSVGLTAPGSGSAAQNTDVNFAAQRISGVGTASWGNRFQGASTTSDGFGFSEVQAVFTVDQPTPFVSDLLLQIGHGGLGEGRLSGPGGATFTFTDVSPTHQEGLLQPGTWTYRLWVGVPRQQAEGNVGAELCRFEVDFRLIPEPATLPFALSAAALLRRPGSRRARRR